MQEKDVPWWKLALINLDTGRTDHREVHNLRHSIQLGEFNARKSHPLFAELLKQAGRIEGTPADWAKHSPEYTRKAALTCPRAFVQFIGLKDDTLKIPILKDFHVRAVNSLRTRDRSIVLLPFGHGKSWLSSMLIPLMDWAENAEFTEGRVYFNDKFSKYYIRKLMQEVENNEQLHIIYPWISRPKKPNPRRGTKGDPCYQIWSVQGFSIAGKQAVEPSFEPLSFQSGTTGRRFWRTIVDDVVNSDNAISTEIQDRLWNYYHTGPETFGRVIPDWWSRHNTRVGTVGVVGTLFDRRDVNFRLMAEYERKEWPVYRVDIFPTKHSEERGEVIWPEERPFEWAIAQRDSMGIKHFNMRCRNLVVTEGEQSFREPDVDQAFRSGQDWDYGVAPPGSYVLIGFDPASGKRTRYSKFPAAVVIGFFNDARMHIVEWGRWSVSMPKQIDMLHDLATKYQSPVAVEDASQQTAYAHWMNQRYPDIRVISHTTNANKRDWIQGVESLIPYFESQNIVIHSKGAPPELLKALREELVEWPMGRYTDLVMAAWIAKFQFSLYQKTQGQQQRGGSVPEFVRRRGLGITVDLKRLKDQAWGVK